MTNPARRRSTHLLSDHPAEADAFEGGHERVAEALAQLIEDEPGGKALALSGPFGSGKSTVVRLLENRLETEKEDTLVFVYDAWEHQGDPLRRSFIEGLVEVLRAEGWAGTDDWSDEKERLARRKEKTTVETKPKLTTLGRWVALALFLSPLGLVAVSSFVANGDGALQTGMPEVAFWGAGLFVALLPLLLVGLALLSGQKDAFYTLVQESQQEEETKTIRTPDPTTIEFQTIFRGIVGETLADANRRLIIVVDNLDRLPPDQALQTWATMRTFFANGTTRDSWERRFWLLVPINFDALNGVFGEGDDTEETPGPAETNSKETDSAETDASPAGSNGIPPVDPAQEAVQAFADKTFHTVFHVAPPVLSDWEAFMKEQLQAAFPKTTPDGTALDRDYHAVYRVYRTQGIRGNQIPTPRDIKIFINRLSALYRQWGGQMSLKMLAAFELMRSRISPNGYEITHGTLLSDRLAAELEPAEWKEPFAALHFNVVPERSIQVLIGEEVQTALETGNAAPLADVQEVDGFDAVMDQVVQDIAEEGTEREVAHAAVVLDEVAITTPNVRTRAWRLLRRRMASTSGWYPSTAREGTGLVNILRHAPTKQADALAPKLLTMIASADIAEDSVTNRRTQIAGWLDGVMPLIRAALDVAQTDVSLSTGTLRGTFHMPQGEHIFIDGMRALSDEDDADRLAPFVPPHPDDSPEQLDTAMQEMIQSDLFDLLTLGGLVLMRHQSAISSIAWTKTTEALFQELQWNVSFSDEDLIEYLEGVLVLGAVFDESSVAKLFGSNSSGRANLSHFLYKHQDHPEIAALCILLRAVYSASHNHGANNGSARAGHNFFVQILNNPSDHQDIVDAAVAIIRRLRITWDVLQSASQYSNTTAFLKYIVAGLADHSDSARHLTANVACAFPNLIHDNLTHERAQEVFREANQDGAVLQKLNELSKQKWLGYLKEETDHLHVVAALSGSDDVTLGSDFSDALLDHATWMLDSEAARQHRHVEWRKVLDALSDDARDALLGKIQGLLLKRCDQPIAPVLAIYQETLSDSATARATPLDDADDAFGGRFPTLLNRETPTELHWLADVITDRPELEQHTSDAYWNDVGERVVAKGSNATGALRDAFEGLANAMSLSLPGPDAKDTGNG